MTRVACDSAGHAHRVAKALREADMASVAQSGFDGVSFSVTVDAPRDEVRRALTEARLLRGVVLSEGS